MILNGFVMKILIASIRDSEIIRSRSGFTSEHIIIGPVRRFDAIKDHHNFVRTAGIGSSSPLTKISSR